MALGLLKWPLSDVINAFRTMAGEVFRKEQGFTGLIRMLVRLCQKGAKYDRRFLYHALQETLGSAPIRGTGDQDSPEVVRVAVTSSDSQSELCLFRSYAETLYPNPPIGGANECPLRPPLLWKAYDKT